MSEEKTITLSEFNSDLAALAAMGGPPAGANSKKMIADMLNFLNTSGENMTGPWGKFNSINDFVLHSETITESPAVLKGDAVQRLGGNAILQTFEGLTDVTGHQMVSSGAIAEILGDIDKAGEFIMGEFKYDEWKRNNKITITVAMSGG